MVNIKKHYLVGDKFKGFLNNPCVISISSLEAQIKAYDINKSTDRYIIYVGQGVESARLNTLRQHIFSKNLADIYQLEMRGFPDKASNLLTHKYKLENIMISEPIRMQDTIFSSALRLDDNCAEMSDHVTGQHLQGMVLIEAARQMTLAVTEKYYISPQSQGKMSFVTDSLKTSFKSYLFPLDIELKYIINKIRGFEENQRFDTTTQFIQHGKVATEVDYTFSVFKPDYVIQKETQMALASIHVGLVA